MASPLVSIRDLHTYFHTEDGVVKAVDGVSLDVHEGETVGLVGESGSGKSVTCLSVMRLVPEPPGYYPRGAIRFGEHDMLQLRPSRLQAIRGNEISMIFQDPMTSLNPYLTVARQLTEVLEKHARVSVATARRQAIEMLERVGIPDVPRRIDQYPHQFSGGMRQRVMIAMALLCRPKLLIADEPTTALDVTIQAQILELIAQLQHDVGTAVLFVTHDLGVVAGITDTVAVMYAGRVVEYGPTDGLFRRPSHPYTRGLLRSVPRLDVAHTGLHAIPGLPPDLSRLPPGCPFHPRCDDAESRCQTDYPDRVEVGGGQWAACWRIDSPNH